MGGDVIIVEAGLDGSHPTMLTTIAGVPGPFAFALNRDGIYWTTGTALMKVGLAGGPQLLLASDPPMGAPVADDQNVYWIASRGSGGCATCESVMKIGDSGGQSIELARSDGTYALGDLAVDTNHVYWLTENATVAMRVAIDGGTPETVLRIHVSPVGFAASDSAIYWTETSGTIYTGQPDARVLGAGGGSPASAIGFDATSVYWVGATPQGSVLWKTPR